VSAVFNDLDSTLTQVLNDAPSTELPELRNADVSFVTPDRGFNPAQATVDLFLYEVRENRELRDPTPTIERDGERFIRRPAPLRVECSYVVTTWESGSTGPARVATEHQLLGQALTWLSRFETIPAQYRQGVLGDPGLVYPPPTMVAQLDPNQHAGDFWTAMGVAPRPAFYLAVSVELSLGQGISGNLVFTRSTGFSVAGEADAPWVQIGGRVVSAPPAATGVGDAVVDVLDLTLRTRSSADGSFSFPRVPPGSHTIRAVARGFQPRTQPLVVPARPEDYVVELTPI
jgi:uncharacterized protein DUF4255/carboxypeptidase family protein